MIKYAHIGMPKAASSWLQTSFFPDHPELMHLGRGKKNWVVDNTVRHFLWNDAISTPAYCFDSAPIRAAFDAHYKQAAQAAGIKAVGVSQELFTNMFFERLDLPQRAERLRAAMGDEVVILFVIRNQFDFLLSHYDTSIWQLGYTQNIEDHFSYVYYDRDIGPFANLYYDKIYDTYAGLFGAANIRVVPFELIRQGPRVFGNAICDALGISHFDGVATEKVNDKNSDEVRAALLKYNQHNHYSIGGPPHLRALPAHQDNGYREKFGIDVPERVRQNLHHFYFAMSTDQDKLVQEVRSRYGEIPVEKLVIPEFYRGKMQQELAPHNRKLADITGLDLEALGYII